MPIKRTLVLAKIPLLCLSWGCQDHNPDRIERAPVIEILEPPPSDTTPVFDAAEPIVFVASVSDEYDAVADLLIQWSSEYLDGVDTVNLDLGESTADESGRTSHTVNSLPSATHTVTVAVTDTDGMTGYAHVNLEILPGNSAPNVEIEEPADDESFLEGDVVTFVASVDDDQSPDTLTVSWISNLDGEFDTESPTASGVLIVATDALSVGDHAISVQVIDDGGLTDEAAVTIHIEAPNAPPSEPAVEIVPADPTTGDDLLCVASDSIDPNGDTVTYSYAWYKDEVLQPALTTNTAPASETEEGQVWKCVVTPNDGTVDGLPGEDQVTILTDNPPASEVGEIVPFWQNTVPFDVPFSASDDHGLASVTLWFSYSPDDMRLVGPSAAART